MCTHILVPFCARNGILSCGGPSASHTMRTPYCGPAVQGTHCAYVVECIEKGKCN